MYCSRLLCALALLFACTSEKPAPVVVAAPVVVDAGPPPPEKTLSPIGGPCHEDADCTTAAGPPWCMDKIRGLRRRLHTPEGYCTTLSCPGGGCGPSATCGSLNGAGSFNCLSTCTGPADCDLTAECSRGACMPKQTAGAYYDWE